MNRSNIALAFAAVAALGSVATSVSAAETGSKQPVKYEKCYGVSTAGKNDCAAGAHSCAGQSTVSRDKASFVELPAGACAKIEGGSTKAG